MARTRRRRPIITARLDIPDRTCYGCGSSEHLFRDCPSPTAPGPKCWRCGSDGHLARSCPVVIVDPSQVPPEQRAALAPQYDAQQGTPPQHYPYIPDPPSTTITYHYYPPPGPTYGPPPPPHHMVPYGGYPAPGLPPPPSQYYYPYPQQPLPGMYGPSAPATAPMHRFHHPHGAMHSQQPSYQQQSLRPESLAQSQPSSGSGVTPTTSNSTSTPSTDETKDRNSPPEPTVKCFACGGDNHIAKNCTARRSRSAFSGTW